MAVDPKPHNGMVGGFSYVDNDMNNIVGTSDKTWQEIDNALSAGTRCVVVTSISGASGHRQIAVEVTGYDDGKYGFIIGSMANGIVAETTSVDGYPSRGVGIV